MFTIPDAPRALLVGEFDGDGLFRELIIAFQSVPWLEIHSRAFGGGFEEASRRIDLRDILPDGAPISIRQAMIFDADGDHADDLAILNGETGRVMVFVNSGAGEFALGALLEPPESEAMGFASAPLDPGLSVDFVVATDALAFLHYRQGDTLEWRPFRRGVNIGAGTRHVLAGDFRRLGQGEIVTVGAEGVHLVHRNANRVFVRADANHIDITDADAADCADLNDDTFLDLLFARTARDEVAIHLTNVDREWVPNRPAALEVPSPVAVGHADADGDGREDILIGSAPAGDAARVFLATQRQ